MKNIFKHGILIFMLLVLAIPMNGCAWLFGNKVQGGRIRISRDTTEQNPAKTDSTIVKITIGPLKEEVKEEEQTNGNK